MSFHTIFTITSTQKKIKKERSDTIYEVIGYLYETSLVRFF